MALKRKPPKFVVIDGCPVPYDVAPYIWLVLRRARQTAASVYRGSDPAARKILRKFGKHTQAEIHLMYPDISNPEGFSQHDLHDDAGNPIPTWKVGVDSGSNSPADKRRIEAAARHYGLLAHHPYSRGVEGHHWQFARKPVADGVHLTKTRVILTRAMLRARS